MGKNQAYKAMQRSRVGSGNGGPDEIEDGMVDGSFHTPEWHAARLANLKTSHTVTWEEFKMKQKEDALKRGEQEADKDRMMREYRAQLDAEREKKLAQGSNHFRNKSKDVKHKKDKEKSSKKHSSKKRKRSRRRSSDSSSSSSESSSSDDEERESRKSKSKSKKTRKERKNSSSSSRSRRKNSSSDGEEEGPLPLSRFFGSIKT